MAQAIMEAFLMEFVAQIAVVMQDLDDLTLMLFAFGLQVDGHIGITVIKVGRRTVISDMDDVGIEIS
jgi:hypothetical protein